MAYEPLPWYDDPMSGRQAPEPYRCTHCRLVSRTWLQKPRCEGLRAGPRHPSAPMEMLEEDEVSAVSDLIVK